MTEQLCPICGCTIPEGLGEEQAGIIYCCRPCAEGHPSNCDCGCCQRLEELPIE
ncbi:MAG: hypothetical protein HQ553_16235 [Chloroflexi bacterium]|nr:hypothetical protein [Chloroflexota bacterium]